MNRKTTLIAAIMVLLLGVTAVAIVQMSKKDGPGKTAGTTPKRESAEGSSNRFSGDPSSETPKTSNRSEREVKNQALVEEYGEARTNLSRHVSENVVAILDDIIEMGEAMASGKSSFGGGGWMVRGIARRTGIELSEEQREAANELYKDYQKSQLEKTKDAVGQLRSDPTSLMGMVLAGDARSRGDLSEEAYAELQATNADALGDIVNPLDRNNFRGGNPMEDDAFRRGFESILDADQSETYTAKMAENEGQEQGNKQTDITQMPVMDLESMDQAVGSAKQMTSGFRQMMEGMGGLRDLQPQDGQ